MTQESSVKRERGVSNVGLVFPSNFEIVAAVQPSGAHVWLRRTFAYRHRFCVPIRLAVHRP